jgi:hypothetical protein
VEGLAKPIESYQSVATWSSGLREQWGGDPLAEDAEKLQSLEDFCALVGQDPDQLVDFCFLRRKETGERFTSQKRREEIRHHLKEFEAMSGLSGREARRRPNNVVSFLSHNGVLI